MLFKKRSALSRRTFLRGAGACLALPFMEAMLPTHAAAQSMAAPQRFLMYYVPNGMVMDSFTPGAGAISSLPATLQPLERVKSSINVISGLHNNAAKLNGVRGYHAQGTGAFATAQPANVPEMPLKSGISVDQVIADRLRENATTRTRFKSLQLGTDGASLTGNNCDGHICAYMNTISWQDETTPLPHLHSLDQTFDSIFGDLSSNKSTEERAKQRAKSKSILDFVRNDARSLETKLGATDRQILEQYLDSIRDIEMSIDNYKEVVCMAPDAPNVAPGGSQWAYKAKPMADMIAVAFQCDLTRVVSFMLENSASVRSFLEVDGVNVGGLHHQLTHDAALDSLRKIEKWEMTQFAYLLEQLDSKTDVDGNTVLHNSLVFLSSEMSDAQKHSYADLPLITAGSGGGKIRTGEHIQLSGAPDIGQFYLTMIQAMGMDDITSFGMDGHSILPQILV